MRGIFALELMATLAVSALIVMAAAPQLVHAVEDASMQSTGVYMQVLSTALDKYQLTNNNALVAGLPVAGFAIPLAPTVQELVAARYIANPNFPAIVTRQNIPVATRIIPTNCPGVNCQLFGVAYLTQPLTLGGLDVRYDLVAMYLQSTNGAGMASQVNTPTVLTSKAFNTPNPLGAVGGVLAIGTFLDQGIFTRFVQMVDPRDPNLAGNLTVAGTISSPTAVGASDGVAPCLRAALGNTGQITSYAANCIARAWLAANGTVTASNAVGGVQVQLDGNTGNITSFDAAGVSRAGATYAGGNSLLYADLLQNKTNTGGVTSVGGVYGTDGTFGSVVISNTAVAGGACGTANQIVLGSVGLGPVLLVCQGGTYQSAGGVGVGVLGGGCAPNGAPGVTAGGIGLMCVNFAWQTTTDRMGHWAVGDSVVVVNGSVVAIPACSGGGTAMLNELPQAVDGHNFFSYFKASNTGATWTIQIVDGSGNALSGSALAQTGCWYF